MNEWEAARSSARATHVWVDTTGTWGAQKVPGLLIDMRQVERGKWEGYCIVARQHQGVGGVPVTVVEQAWFATGHIRPADKPAPSSGPE